MGRKVIAAVATLMLLVGASALAAQEAAPAASVKRVDARTLVPRDVVLYVEADDLAGTWEAVKAGPLYQEILASGGGKRLQVLAAAVQKQFQVTVGATLEEVLLGLVGERVIVAAWPQEGTTVGALLAQVADPAFAQRVLAAFRQSDIDEGKAARYDQQTYRGHTIYVKIPPSTEPEGETPPEGRKPCKPEYSVLCGNVAVASDSLAAVKLLIDRFEEPQAESVLTNDTLQAALRSLPRGWKAAAFVDFGRALAQQPLDEEAILAGKPPAARFLTRQFLSVVRSLRQAVAGLYLQSSGLQVHLRVRRDPTLLSPEMLAVFSQENVSPGALSYLSSDAVLFVSLPRVAAQMKLLGRTLERAFPPAPAVATEGGPRVQPVRPLDLLFGRSFTREVLPGVGPEISLLVEANPAGEAPAKQGPPARVLAREFTAALFVQLSDDLRPEVERTVEGLLGLLATVGREGFRVAEVHTGGVTGYVVAGRGPKARRLGGLIRPTVAFADGFLVLTTHPRALERALAVKRGEVAGYEARFLATEEPGTLTGQVLLVADLARILKVVEAALGPAGEASAGPAGTGPDVEAPQPRRAKAAREVPDLIDLLRPLAGQLSLTVQHTPAESNLDLTLRTATPLLK